MGAAANPGQGLIDKADRAKRFDHRLVRTVDVRQRNHSRGIFYAPIRRIYGGRARKNNEEYQEKAIGQTWQGNFPLGTRALSLVSILLFD